MKTNQNNKKTVPTQEQIEVVCRQRARHFLELAHLVISLLCGNKPVSYSYKLVYQSTLLVGTMGDSRLGNQLADDSHREKHQILINHKLKRKKQYGRKKIE